MKFKIEFQNGKVYQGDEFTIREHIEKLLTDNFNFEHLYLQEEITEQNEFTFYVHSESFDDMTNDELTVVNKLGLNLQDDDEFPIKVMELLKIKEITREG